MHHVFPPDLAVIPKILFQLFELREHVRVVRAVHVDVARAAAKIRPRGDGAACAVGDAGEFQVESAAVYVGTFLTQPIGSGPDDAPIDHVRIQIGGIWSSGHFILHMLEDREINAAKALLRTVRESDSVAMLRRARGMSDDAYAPARPRENLRAFWNNKVNLLFAFQFRFHF